MNILVNRSLSANPAVSVPAVANIGAPLTAQKFTILDICVEPPAGAVLVTTHVELTLVSVVQASVLIEPPFLMINSDAARGSLLGIFF